MPAATHNPVEAAIAREVHDARATGCQRVVHVRVTPHAIPGSVVAVPIPPERSRLLRADPDLDAIETANYVEIVGRGGIGVLLEILVHPHDWQQLLRDAGSVLIGAPDAVHGLPVRHAH
jgi:hypothetical protein